MQILEAINTIRAVYIHLNPAGFQKYVGSNSYDVWVESGYNIITFINKVNPEYSKKFWDWISRFGVQSIDQIFKIYAILSLIYGKIGLLPLELKDFYSKFNNVPVFIGGLGQNQTEKVAKWAESILTPEEISLATGKRLIEFAQQKIVPTAHGRRALSSRPISTQQKILPTARAVSPRPNSTQQSFVVSKSSSRPSSLGVRSLDQLKKSFGQ